ncbi:MAG: OstA-like protein [Lacunisphaera sp.]|nr:OstA-like protein [Lacunisphaera sp.]
MKLLRPCLLLALGFSPALLPAQSAEPQPTVVESSGPGEMVSTDTETIITFRDNVRVTGTNMKLTCDYLKVVVIRTGDKSATLGKLDKFRSMLATGNVHMIQGDREAACGKAEVLPDQDKIILTETPVIVFHDPEGRQAGSKITMYRGQRRVEIENPVTTLPTIKDLGVDKEKKPATATPAEPAKKP